MKPQNENPSLPNDFMVEEILLLTELSKKTRSQNHKETILRIAERIAEKRNELIGKVEINHRNEVEL